MRIHQHPILKIDEERKKCRIYFEDREIIAYEGDTIASALWASGIKEFRKTLKYRESRGVFCNRGRCTDCIMNVDGKPNVRTCITKVRDGMEIRKLKGLENWRN